MINYLLLYFGTFILLMLSQTYHPIYYYSDGISRRQSTDLFLGTAILWMTCFLFLRTHYNDTSAYINMWNNAPSLSEFIAQDGLNPTSDPFSNLWTTVSRELFSSYHTYFLLPAFLFSYGCVNLLKRYSSSPAFSMLVFFSIGTFALYMAALKQCFAIAIMMFALPYAEKRQYGKYYLLTVIAMLFHTHAFIFALVPLLFEKPWGKVTWFGIGIVVLCTVAYDVTMGSFVDVMDSIGVSVSEDEVFDGHDINILRVAVYWVPPLLAFLYRKRLFQHSSRCENLFVNMSTVAACILTLGTVQAANLFARMAGYFEIASAVALPWIIKKAFDKKTAQTVMIVAGVCYFAYFLFEFTVSKPFASDYRAIGLWDYFASLLGGN